jgi:hypothetical protein
MQNDEMGKRIKRNGRKKKEFQSSLACEQKKKVKNKTGNLFSLLMQG